MWTYVGARVGEKRNDLWAWTAVAQERDGRRWMDFEAGGRDESTLMRLLERLPDAERYETDAYGVYGTLLVNKHVVGKYGAVNRTRDCVLCCAREVESVSASDKWLRKERRYAGKSACASLLRQTQCHSPLRIPNGDTWETISGTQPSTFEYFPTTADTNHFLRAKAELDDGTFAYAHALGGRVKNASASADAHALGGRVKNASASADTTQGSAVTFSQGNTSPQV